MNKEVRFAKKTSLLKSFSLVYNRLEKTVIKYIINLITLSKMQIYFYASVSTHYKLLLISCNTYQVVAIFLKLNRDDTRL